MNRQISRRYAQALYEEADRQYALSTVDEDVELLRESLRDAPELKRVLQSPVISQEKKHAVVDSLIKPRVGALTYRFVELLLRKDREEALAEMLDAYRALRDEHEGVIEADVRTAHVLSDEEKEQLKSAIGRMTGQPNVRLRTSQQSNLLGGVVVRVEDTVYDGSVRHQLASLHERLSHEADVSGAISEPGDGKAAADGGDAASAPDAEAA